MPWVKSEYAGEVAVLSAWLSALVPWSVAYGVDGPSMSGEISFLRFPLFEVQLRRYATILVDGSPRTIDLLTEFYPGSRLFGSLYLTTPPSAASFYADLPGADAVVAAGSWPFWGHVAWTVGAAFVLLAVLLSIAIYRDESGTARRLPVDHVRAMGGLLGLACLAYAIATVALYLGRSVTGVPIPIGVFVVGALAGVLLRADRV